MPANQSPDRGRTTALLLLAAILLSTGVVFVRELPGASRPLPRDFAQYVVAAEVILRHEPDALYFTDLRTGLTTERFPESRFQALAAAKGIRDTSYYIYPPWVGALYIPLAPLRPYPALLALYALSWGMILAALVVTARALPAWGWAAGGIVLVLGAHSHPLEHAVQAGQASIPVYLLFALMAAALWKGRDGQAGVWWALLTGIKLFPFLFVPWAIVLRRWRLLGAYVVAGGGLLAASVLLTDLDAHRRFLGLIADYAGTTTTRATNQSLTGFLIRLVDPSSPGTWGILDIPAWIAGVQRGVTLGALGLTLLLVHRARGAGAWADRLGFALMTIWVLMASANVWSHHLVALFLPLQATAAYLVARRGPSPRSWPWLWIGAWAGILAFSLYLRAGSPALERPPGVLAASTPFYGVVLLFALTAWMLARVGREGKAAA